MGKKRSENVRTKGKTKSIVGKINLLFFVVVAVSAGAIISIYMVKLFRDMVALEERNQRELLMSVNESLNAVCERSETALNYLLGMENLQKYISGSFQNDSAHIFSLYAASEDITTIKYINKDIIDQITFYCIFADLPEHGNQFHHAGYLEKEPQLLAFMNSEETSGWFKGISSEIYLEPDKPVRLMNAIYARKIMGLEGKLMGIFVIALKEQQLQEIIPESSEIYFTESLPEKQQGIYNTYLSGYVTTKKENRDILAVVVGNIVMILMITCSGLWGIECFIRKILKRVFKNMYHMLGDMEKIVDNDFSTRLPENQEQELNEIAIKVNMLLGRIQKNIQMNIELEKQKQHTQMTALQLQMNPHFFYNGLSIVQYTLEEMDRFVESAAISHFSRILRYNMQPESLASVEKEMECVKNYVEFVNAFRSPKMRVEYQADKELMPLIIPKFILQPFAENAVKYGDGKKMAVCASRVQDNLILQVKNTGRVPDNVRCSVNEALKDAYIEENTGKIGLKNIATRLKLFYGKDAEMEIREEKEWVVVEIRIAMVRVEGKDDRGCNH